MAALAPLRLFPVAALPMQAAVAAGCKAEPLVQVAQVAAETAPQIAQPLQMELLIPAAAVAAAVLLRQMPGRGAQAALASSSSNTPSPSNLS